MPSFTHHVLSIAIALTVFAASSAALGAAPNKSSAKSWVGTWGSAQQVAEGDYALPIDAKQNVTIRQFVRSSIGGSTLRVRVSNAFGTEPLHVLAVHIARPNAYPSNRIDPATDRALSFHERPNIVIPAGAELTSDPLNFAVEPLSILAVTMQLETVPALQTGHFGSRTTSYVSAESSAAAPELESAQGIDRWYFLSAIDVLTENGAAIAVIGDSITDGLGSTTDRNDRWTDVLAERLQRSPAHRHIGVINLGIGGNRLLLDGIGSNAVARFDRDVLARSGVRYLIVLEGINDLGMLTHGGPVGDHQHEKLVHEMIQAYSEIITRARTHHIKTIGGTLMPFHGVEYYQHHESDERNRRSVNAWIRTPSHFDAVVDFDKIVADPKQPERLNTEYDSGDHIHPSPVGYRAMGNAIPLELLER